MEPSLGTGGQRRRDHLEGNDRLLERAERRELLDQAAQTGVVAERVTPFAQERNHAGDARRGKDLAAPEALPDLDETFGTGNRRVAGDGGAVEGAHRTPEDHVRLDASLEQGTDHPDLHGAEVSATAQDERRLQVRTAVLRMS